MSDWPHSTQPPSSPALTEPVCQCAALCVEVAKLAALLAEQGDIVAEIHEFLIGGELIDAEE